MSSIPYDLLPNCDPNFVHLKLKQKQSFINRFFSLRTTDDERDASFAPRYTHSTSRAFSFTTSSTNHSYTSLAPTASSSAYIPKATPRRPRANTADSTTSIASFVSQSSAHSSASYTGLRSRSPSRERRVTAEDGWVPVGRYF